jgi:predicted acylesterase/phospholipase RssA
MATQLTDTAGTYRMNRERYSLFFILMLLWAAVLVQGCATPVRRSAVPQELVAKAEVPGLPGVRYLVAGEMPEFLADAQESIKRELEYRAKAGQKGPLPPANFLALSGGGDDGAFGAGLLCGWTAAGTRPEFKLVTGISTGALIAPFAFLGPKYDEQLKAIYTNTPAKDILTPRNRLAAIFNDAMADNAPLWRLARKYVTEEMLREVAQEHAKGRILLVATTNLDARLPIIWNMGKIAASDHPKALELFRSIMIASAAIPGAFPPVMIDVEAEGKQFHEMHVDGGAVAQVFVYPVRFHLKERAAEMGIQRERRLYLIRNSRLDPGWAEVERRTLTIAGRAIASLILTQGVGDLYRIYSTSQRDGVDYNLAFIPETFNAPHKEEFDTEYMRQLFQVGYDRAVKGYTWLKKPPGF